MHIILLSGGSGKRLWPLSSEARPKQFLKVLKTPDGSYESMAQRIFRQLKAAGLAKNTVIAANKNQEELLYNQLGSHVTIVKEPEQKDTFPAIALACAFLFNEKRISKDEIIAVLPADAYTDQSFLETVKELARQIKDSSYAIGLVGVRPEQPSEKYGYIIPKTKQEEGILRSVAGFKEKPDIPTAKKLLKENALWNCGIFAFRLGYITDILEDRLMLKAPYYEQVKFHYKSFNKSSFDYEILEKEQNIAVMEYSGSWQDLGTWDTLTDYLGGNIIGDAVASETSLNTHIINELGVPIAVVGVKDAIVAASADGIIIVNKQDCGSIKQYIGGFDKRPMYVERRWGAYKILDYRQDRQGRGVLTKHLRIESGKNISYQSHEKRNEIWTITAGEGAFILENQIKTVVAGNVLEIPSGQKHAIKAISSLELIEVQIGQELSDEDIQRYAFAWDEITKLVETGGKT